MGGLELQPPLGVPRHISKELVGTPGPHLTRPPSQKRPGHLIPRASSQLRRSGDQGTGGGSIVGTLPTASWGTRLSGGRSCCAQCRTLLPTVPHKLVCGGVRDPTALPEPHAGAGRALQTPRTWPTNQRAAGQWSRRSPHSWLLFFFGGNRGHLRGAAPCIPDPAPAGNGSDGHPQHPEAGLPRRPRGHGKGASVALTCPRAGIRGCRRGHREGKGNPGKG